MRNKIPSPKIFTQESVATPKHDEMLLKFAKDSLLLSTVLKLVIADHLKDVKFEFIEKEGKIFFPNYYSEHEHKFYVYGEGEEKVHIGELYLPPDFNIRTVNWIPEKPIVNRGYYVGSIDLFVEIDGKAIYEFRNLQSKGTNLIVEKSLDEFHKEYRDGNLQQSGFIIEFKPLIKSFSEVIRQVKVYQKYFEDAIPIVITNSGDDIVKKYRDIFYSQGIHIYTVENIEILSQLEVQNKSS